MILRGCVLVKDIGGRPAGCPGTPRGRASLHCSLPPVLGPVYMIKGHDKLLMFRTSGRHAGFRRLLLKVVRSSGDLLPRKRSRPSPGGAASFFQCSTRHTGAARSFM